MGKGSCNERDLSIKVECRHRRLVPEALRCLRVYLREDRRSRAGSVIPLSLGLQGYFTQRIEQLFAGYCAAAGIILGLPRQAYSLFDSTANQGT